MKKLAILLSTLAPLLVLPSCVVEPGASGPGYNPSSYAPANRYEAPLQTIYNQGYSSGKADATRGRSPDPFTLLLLDLFSVFGPGTSNLCLEFLA